MRRLAPRLAALACAALAALAGLAAAPQAAAEEPEAAYAKYHRAAASGDLDESARYLPEAQRAEVARMSPAQRDAQVKVLTAMTPRAFLLRKKLAARDGGVVLIVSGQAENPSEGKLETIYGTVKMLQERGEWKVAETRWTTEAPPALAAGAAPVAAGGAAGAAAAKAPPKGAAPVVGSMNSAPERKLGRQKPECVYKPVMTAEDLENCR